MTEEHIRPDSGERVVQWVAHNRRGLTVGAVAVALVAGGVLFTRSAQVRRSQFAQRELISARSAVDAGNLQLAASDLGRIVQNFSGTSAAQEAVLLLANVHLQQGQPELAVTVLQELLAANPDGHFVGQAAGLLGAALEEAGRPGEAADAYQRAVDATDYEMIRDQYRLDLGRAASNAGDNARAMAAYQAIIDDNPESPTAAEARFRLAEVSRR